MRERGGLQSCGRLAHLCTYSGKIVDFFKKLEIIRAVRNKVAQRHHTVAQVYRFYDGVLVARCNVIRAEIPVIADAERIELVDSALYRGTRDAEDRHNGMLIRAEILERRVGENGKAGEFTAGDVLVAVKDAGQREAGEVVCDVRRDRLAEVTGAEQNALVLAAEAEGFADLLAQLWHGVAVALLAIAAEAVEILPDL